MMIAPHIEVIEGPPATAEAEFLQAYDLYVDQIFRHALLGIRDRELAKDIAQETFTRTWAYLAHGKKVEHFKAFLFRTCNNLIIDTVRRKKSCSLDALMEETGFDITDDSTPAPTQKHAIREMLEALKSLDEIYRTAIEMRYVDGMLPCEIAQSLGVSVNVVSVRIHRGVERLSRLMYLKIPPLSGGVTL